MKLVHLKDVLGTDREVGGEEVGWTSRRLLLASDRMGFSLHDTLIHPEKPLRLHYNHHLEAVYCIEGKARLTDLSSGEVHVLTPGTVYALDQHDEHILQAEVLSRFVCVFNPPVTGTETHDASGAYPAPASD
jgi:L-ectoine synthase